MAVKSPYHAQYIQGFGSALPKDRWRRSRPCYLYAGDHSSEGTFQYGIRGLYAGFPSMVFTDPKMEIARMSATLLKKRGYRVISLNFIDPSHTHCINPLSAIYRLYKNGYESDAELMLNTLANDICFANVNDMRNKYFYDNAAQLFSALALSIIIDSSEKEKKTGRVREKD